MPRLVFEKTGNAVWISHLDLMRLFQRAFKRAGLPLTHTQGFNPRPSVSIALPLSVGIESYCELLDFDLDGDMKITNEEIRDRLNQSLVSGVQVRDVYSDGRKIRDLSLLRCALALEYDRGIPENAVENIRQLFASPFLEVEKKSKNGVTQQDVIPMIRNLDMNCTDDHIMNLDAVICCQNPSLNPTQLYAAIVKYLPQYAPDYMTCRRIEVYDPSMNVFR